MTSKQVVTDTVKFQTPKRLAIDFLEEYGSDFYKRWLWPSPDGVYSNETDEWGSVWKNIGKSHIGQVVEHPIKEWSDLERINIPDVEIDNRWDLYRNLTAENSSRFITVWGVSLFERVKHLRGVENAWTDPYDHPDELSALIDILTEMNIKMIKKCPEFSIDGFFIADDWGLQDALLLPPDIFRKFWLPGYEKIFTAAHEQGITTLMHSCGCIVSILDDLINAGLDVINMDQQENMGLEMLGRKFAGRVTFFCPVDIQKTMAYGTPDDIKKYCRKMIEHLWRPEGGFIAKWYNDPVGAGHSAESVKTMCEEFLKINKEIYG